MKFDGDVFLIAATALLLIAPVVFLPAVVIIVLMRL